MLEAREHFVQGTKAVEEGRWADAVDRFSQAYELSEVPAALFNVAFSLRALGRHVEARTAFEQLLERHRDQLKDAMRREAVRLLAEESARIARVRVVGLDPDVRYTIHLDGARVDDEGDRPVVLELDAGSHTLALARKGFFPFRWEGWLTDGQRAQIRARFEPVPVAKARPSDEGRSVFSRPLFWTLVGVLAVGGGVTAAVLLRDDGQLDPLSDRRVDL